MTNSSFRSFLGLIKFFLTMKEYGFLIWYTIYSLNTYYLMPDYGTVTVGFSCIANIRKTKDCVSFILEKLFCKESMH